MNSLPKLVITAGARPNFPKIAPLLREASSTAGFQSVLVHTGQHYDDALSRSFLRDLDIPEPPYNLAVGSGSHAQQTAEVMKRFEPVLLAEEPDGVVVVGDVNSTLACALVASKLHIPVIHVEAGLRSFDRSMPEEINRVLTDAISDLLLVTDESGAENLRREDARGAIVEAGNLMIDSLFYGIQKARSSSILERLNLVSGGPYGVVTLHRPYNVDTPYVFDEIMSALEEISRDLPLIFSVHPRTRKQVADRELTKQTRIRTTEALGYLDFLQLMRHAAAVFTDSGGIQEETSALHIPCFTLRDNTERPVTITCGSNTLAGTSRRLILEAWSNPANRAKTGAQIPLWDGRAAGRSVSAIAALLGRSTRAALLELIPA